MLMAVREQFQKYHRNSGSFVSEDTVKSHEFAQKLSFYKCNI
jgi:hypothetical protein